MDFFMAYYSVYYKQLICANYCYYF